MMSSNASATVRPKRKRDGTAVLTSSPYLSEVKSKLDSKKKLLDKDCLATPISKTKCGNARKNYRCHEDQSQQ